MTVLPSALLIVVSVLLVILVLESIPANGVHRTLDEAKAARERLVKKHLKRLRKEEGAIKLVGGANEYEGNVEILHLDKWGSVCDDEWDSREAEVVCRQLGFAGFEKATHSGMFGPAKRKFWMDNVLCNGSEGELAECRFEGWSQNDCESSEAAGVVCKAPPNAITRVITPSHSLTARPTPKKRNLHKHKRVQFRLSGGRVPSEGRVEMRLGGGAAHSWGTVCGDGWSLLEANVLCKSLGLGYANYALQTDFFNARWNHSSSKMVLSGTECYGNETSLQDCVHHTSVSCPADGNKHHVASVICVEQMADLVFQHRELEQSAHLEDRPIYFLQCAMEENCLASQAYQVQKENANWHHETRRLLKFTASVLNDGTADFRPSIPKHMWEWHMCHMHYHSMEVFAVFNIFNDLGEKVAEGHKASFCLEDNQCKEGVERKYTCANYGDQGISIDCYDIYKYNIDCQWVDITEMEPGLYTLQVAVNPEFKVAEMAYDNNAAVCKLLYTETYARVYDCQMQKP